jgi:hypothetical protein
MGAEWQKKAASQHGLFWVAGRDVTRKSCRQGQAAIFGITCFGSRSVHSVTSLVSFVRALANPLSSSTKKLRRWHFAGVLVVGAAALGGLIFSGDAN